METYAAVEEVAQEEINTIKEAANAYYILPPATTSKLGGVIIGDGLSIDDEGKLKVEGLKTETIDLNNILPDGSSANILLIFDIGDTVPVGVEIAKIEGSWDGKTYFDFKRIYEEEPLNPYFIANTHTFSDASLGMTCIVAISFTRNVASWASRISQYELQSIRLTYYTD